MNSGPGTSFGSWYLLPAERHSQIAIATDDVTVKSRPVITLPGKGRDKVKLQQYLFNNAHLWSPEREWVLDANPQFDIGQIPQGVPAGHPVLVKPIEKTVIHVKIGVEGILAVHEQTLGQRRIKLNDQSLHWKFAKDVQSIAPNIFQKITAFLANTDWHIAWTRLTFGKAIHTNDFLIVGAIADPDNASIEQYRSQCHFDRSLIKACDLLRHSHHSGSPTIRSVVRQYSKFFELGS